LDPQPDSPWSTPATVAGFSRSPPNATLIRFAEAERDRRGAQQLLDVGCGAGRNAHPLAELGFEVVGLDLSMPMLQAAIARPRRNGGRLALAQASMDHLPVPDRTFDVVIAHGIWNLAGSGAEFRRGLTEAARVSREGAGLFVFTFSRNTLPAEATPVPGETFVFTQFSGRPQCFLSETELILELGVAGFSLDEDVVKLTEHNRPRPGQLQAGSGPVIFEAAFRRVANS
jgi:SAM-dependent methyltransferase